MSLNLWKDEKIEKGGRERNYQKKGSIVVGHLRIEKTGG